MTEYVVLVKTEGETWKVLGTAPASSPQLAIKQVIGDSGGAGVYVTVPTRSWQPVKMSVKQVQRMLWEQV
jgi:hypothetical protein